MTKGLVTESSVRNLDRVLNYFRWSFTSSVLFSHQSYYPCLGVVSLDLSVVSVQINSVSPTVSVFLGQKDRVSLLWCYLKCTVIQNNEIHEGNLFLIFRNKDNKTEKTFDSSLNHPFHYGYGYGYIPLDV